VNAGATQEQWQMQLKIEALDQSAAEEIASWHYEGEYTFYDFASDQEDLEELLDPELRGETMFKARNPENELVGFFSFNQIAGALDIGVGLRPDLTGQGLGRSFVDAGLVFAKMMYSPEVIQLRVAAFNKRAIKVYERAGFVAVEHFLQRTNGGEFDFVRMEWVSDSTS
jgi:ribosomal-protein-alanine N-acetyltransferase